LLGELSCERIGVDKGRHPHRTLSTILRNAERATNVMWIGAGVLAATGASLVLAGWASAPDKKTAGAVALHAHPGWLGVAGRF
jgi:hypothetical protein